jgi:hypothetical protein
MTTTKPVAPAAQSRSDKDRVELARTAYESVFKETLNMLAASPRPEDGDPNQRIFSAARAEQLYLWSKRWMEAQRDLGRGQEGGEIAAIQAHLERMKDLESGALIKAWVKVVQLPTPTDDAIAASMEMIPAFRASIKFYRAEAESWLSRAGGR